MLIKDTAREKGKKREFLVVQGWLGMTAFLLA
jgi:hypothetical protein